MMNERDEVSAYNYAAFVGWSSQEAYMDGLAVAGPQAVADFRAATARWTGGTPPKKRVDPPQ